jgi:hypothetical protein
MGCRIGEPFESQRMQTVAREDRRPIAAWRIAWYNSARGSSGTASNTSKRRSTSAPTWVKAALSDGELAIAPILMPR